MRKISIIALLLTLIVMFSFQGEIVLNDPLLVAYLAAPNLLHYVTMISITYTTSWLSNWDYETSIDTTLRGSSSHFEVAIAVATTPYGLNSGAVLATVIGPLMEVPLMLSIVRFGLRTRHLFPRNKMKNQDVKRLEVQRAPPYSGGRLLPKLIEQIKEEYGDRFEVEV